MFVELNLNYPEIRYYVLKYTIIVELYWDEPYLKKKEKRMETAVNKVEGKGCTEERQSQKK